MRQVFSISFPVTLLIILLGLNACSPGIPPDSYSYSGKSPGGSVDLDPGLVDNLPGLSGFMLDFDDDDHQNQTIMAGFFQDNQGQPRIRVIYADQNGDDDFSWTVDGIELPPGTTFHEEHGTSNIAFNGTLTESGSGRVPVLTGFAIFTLNSGDHNIDAIRVQLWPGYFGLTYQDEDGDHDIEYEYIIAYALVPADQVRTTGILSGSDGGGSDSATFGAIYPLLQGFELDFKDDDHELDQIGVRLAPGTADISFNDKNDDDDFTWEISWVDLISR